MYEPVDEHIFGMVDQKTRRYNIQSSIQDIKNCFNYLGVATPFRTPQPRAHPPLLTPPKFERFNFIQLGELFAKTYYVLLYFSTQNVPNISSSSA